MLGTVAVMALFGTIPLQDETSIYCNFRDPGSELVQVELHPSPSLWETGDTRRFRLTMNDTTTTAEAQPIANTSEPDVMIKANGLLKRLVAIGLRNDGKAALNIRSANKEPRTLSGDCHGNLDYLNRWIQSAN